MIKDDLHATMRLCLSVAMRVLLGLVLGLSFYYIGFQTNVKLKIPLSLLNPYPITSNGASCAPMASSNNFDKFNSSGGLRATSCPPTTHLETYTNTPCSWQLPSDMSNQSLSALVIGGNSGSDCAGMLSLLSGSVEFSLSSWISAIESATGMRYPKPVCPHSKYPLMKHMAGDPRTAHVYCVEPLPANANAIAKAANLKPFKGYLKQIKAAVVDVIPDKGTISFSKTQGFGFEKGHIEIGMYKGMGKEAFEPVVATTVDTIIDEYLGGVAPMILSIDTEGFDGLVLKGASRALTSGRIKFIEFEYHSIGPWRTMHLKDTIAFLDRMGYTCYFASRNGPIPLNCFDWNKFHDEHGWSNVICANRNDDCWVNAIENARNRQRN